VLCTNLIDLYEATEPIVLSKKQFKNLKKKQRKNKKQNKTMVKAPA
jgi:hypothetical protein